MRAMVRKEDERAPALGVLPAPGGKELFAQMREYLTAAKKEYLANDTAQDFVQRMRAVFPSFDGDVLLHHQLRFFFPKSQNFRRESAVA